jgi:4-amino-4-deoxy-L-arabinose transferase-like glycosyltransferase
MSDPFDRMRGETAARPTRRANPGQGLVKVLDFCSLSHWRAYIFLAACAIVFLLPGFLAIPPFDREEARFAQTARQMIESGNYVDPRFQHERLGGENLASYWLQAAVVTSAMKLGLPRAQVRIWLYRVPSLIGAIGAALMTYWAALAFVGRRDALLAGMMISASLILGVVARIASPSATLFFLNVAAMGAMARAYLLWQRGDDGPRREWGIAAIFWTSVGAALVIGGISALMVIVLATLTLAVLDRSAGWLSILQPVWGILWLIVILALWSGAVLWAGGDQELLLQSLGSPVFGRLTRISLFDGGPPGLQFVMFWATFWPAATLAGLVAPAVWLARREPGAQFLLAWLLPAWIVIELFFPKMPHYILPLLPAIAILIAGAIERRVLSGSPWLAYGPMWWFVVPAVLSVAAVVASIALARQPAFAAWPFAAAAMILGLAAWLLYDINRAERSMLNAISASLFIAVAIYGVLAPSLVSVFPSVQLSRLLRNMDCKRPVAASAGYHEPSVVFMTEAATLLTDASGAADFLRHGPCRFVFVEAKQERAFAQRADAIGLRYAVVTRVEGFNYSKGRRISVAVFRSEVD